jgi:hypothetical protein
MLIFGVLATAIKGVEQFKLSRMNPESKQIKLCLWSVYSLVALNISLAASFITYVLYDLDGFHPGRLDDLDNYTLPITMRLAICTNLTIAHATILLEVFAALHRYDRSCRVTGDRVRRDRVGKDRDDIYIYSYDASCNNQRYPIPALVVFGYPGSKYRISNQPTLLHTTWCALSPYLSRCFLPTHSLKSQYHLIPHVVDRTIKSRSELRVQLLIVLATLALINIVCPLLYVFGLTLFPRIYFELSIFSGIGIVFYVVLNCKLTSVFSNSGNIALPRSATYWNERA